ncbi:MAG: prolyl oligopeptidase family serine peptidase [Methylobacterium frigidaeris]
MQQPVTRTILSLKGDPDYPTTLKVHLLTPPGEGRFPLAIYNSGSTRLIDDRDVAERHNNFLVSYLLSRGYAVALVYLRGFTAYSDSVITDFAGCDVVLLGRRNARDLSAIVDQLARMPNLNAKRVLMSGASYGGWNSLAAGASGDARVAAVLNFFAGIGSKKCTGEEGSAERGSGILGRGNKTPSIWFYGDNDRLISRAMWMGMYRAYTDAGGRAELVQFGNFRDDGHGLLAHPSGLPIFVPKVDAFLKRHGMPHQLVHPHYLPLTAPPPSGFAAVDDIGALPVRDEAVRRTYAEFLKEPFPRAFVIAPGKSIVSASGTFDPLADALKACRESGLTCYPYAIDGDVVWAPPAAEAPKPGQAPSGNGNGPGRH